MLGTHIVQRKWGGKRKTKRLCFLPASSLGERDEVLSAPLSLHLVVSGNPKKEKTMSDNDKPEIVIIDLKC